MGKMGKGVINEWMNEWVSGMGECIYESMNWSIDCI